ncbi:MAG: hypothetical protein ACPGWR_20460 [Ardenticatenaceae bacterium]
MLKIEELSRKHNRKEFDCGVPALNQYLKKTARKNKVFKVSKIMTEQSPPLEQGAFSVVTIALRKKTWNP